MKPTKVFLLLCSMFCFSQAVKAQTYLLASGAMDLGLMQATTFENGTLSSKNATLTGFDLGLEYRFRNTFAVELGAGQYFESYRFQDPTFEADYTAHSLVYNHRSAYMAYGGAVQFFVPIKWDAWLYGKCYYSMAIDRQETIAESFDYEILSANVRETVSAETNFTNRNNSIIPEIGIQTHTDNDVFLSFGIQMNLNQSGLVSGSYKLYNQTDGELLRSDNFLNNGNSVSLNFKASVPLHEFVKREKIKPQDKPEDPIDDEIIVMDNEKKEEEKKEEEVVVEEKTKTPEAKLAKNKSGEPLELNERTILKTKTVHVKADSIILRIWDNGAHVDGDSVSINLNGEWILKDFRLRRKQHEIVVPLERRSDNYIILYALNLGTSPPNTAAVIIYDGKRQKVMRLSSDMNTCGAINIINK
ncbi:MAG: hypothetical protein JXQ87_16180 [Bacteroidia bacterium]